MTTSRSTIEFDNQSKRFFQGVNAGGRVETEHAVVEFPDHEARVAMYWFYVGALAGGEYQCTTGDDFAGFIRGATLRAPQAVVEDEEA